jgi:phage tail tape-measure protein
MESVERNENSEQALNEKIGGAAGMGAGILTGARFGSALIPIPVIGTFTGALVGGVLGTEIGRRVGAATLSGFNAFLETLTAPPKREDEPSDQTQ